MKTFSYSGYRTGGQSVNGLVHALDRKDAREQLIQQGILAGDVTPAQDEVSVVARRTAGHISVELRAQIFREWALLLKAGHSLNQSIELLLEAPEFKSVQPSIARIRDEVRDGGSLSDALHSVSVRWRPFEQAVLEVGERTGRLSESLLTVADYLDQELSLREQTLTALLYPLLVLGAAILIVGISCTWLLPSFQTTLEEAGLSIPGWAGGLIVAGRWGSMLALVAALGGLLGYRALRHQVEQRKHILQTLEGWGAQTPGLNTYLETLYTQRFCQALSILLTSGVPLVEACPLAAKASGSALVFEKQGWIEHQIREGVSLAGVIADVPWLQNGLPGWLRAGEESGALAEVLHQAGERAARRGTRLRERFLRLLEPVMIAVIGLFVMALSFGLLSPILSMNELLGQ